LRRITHSSQILSRTSSAFRTHAASDPALAWAVDATSNPYSVFQHAAGFFGGVLAAVVAFRLASGVLNYILWDYAERKSDDPNRPYDLSLDLERGGRGKATSASIFDSPTVSTAEGEVPSDMELLMAEFVRLDVGSEEINAAISQVLDDGKEGNSGMLAIYNVLVWGMQRRVMTAATLLIVIALGAQQKLSYTIAADLLDRSLQAPKRHWTGLLASTVVDGNMMALLSLYGLTHVRRSRELVALCSGQLSTAQAFDATLRMTKCLDSEEFWEF